MQLFHGLAAFRGTRLPLDQLRAAARLLTGIEIAAATRPIGPIGVMVQGSITAAYSNDVWSEINNTGARYASDNSWYDQADDKALAMPHLIERWLKTNCAETSGRRAYCE